MSHGGIRCGGRCRAGNGRSTLSANDGARHAAAHGFMGYATTNCLCARPRPPAGTCTTIGGAPGKICSNRCVDRLLPRMAADGATSPLAAIAVKDRNPPGGAVRGLSRPSTSLDPEPTALADPKGSLASSDPKNGSSCPIAVTESATRWESDRTQMLCGPPSITRRAGWMGASGTLYATTGWVKPFSVSAPTSSSDMVSSTATATRCPMRI